MIRGLSCRYSLVIHHGWSFRKLACINTQVVMSSIGCARSASRSNSLKPIKGWYFKIGVYTASDVDKQKPTFLPFVVYDCYSTDNQTISFMLINKNILVIKRYSGRRWRKRCSRLSFSMKESERIGCPMKQDQRYYSFEAWSLPQMKVERRKNTEGTHTHTIIQVTHDLYGIFKMVWFFATSLFGRSVQNQLLFCRGFFWSNGRKCSSSDTTLLL